MVEIKINLDSEDLKRTVERQIIKSDVIEDIVGDILDREEIKELITEKIKEILVSKEVTAKIVKKLNDYIEEEFDISNEDDVMSEITERATDLIKSMFNKKESL